MSGDAHPVRTAFREQAEACRALGSPFTGRVLDHLADRLDPAHPVGDAVLGWAGDAHADALALRMTGALHGLVLEGAEEDLAAVYPPAEADPDRLCAAIERSLDRHADRILDWLQHPPQTNEVARSAVLLPGLLAIARETGRPIDLMELGASSGLNLHPDRFHYVYGSSSWGEPDSAVRLATELRGAAPSLGGDLVIAGRAGCDARPLDPADPQHRLRLAAFTWPDQPYRLERQAAALKVAAENRVDIDRRDAAEWLEERLSDPSSGRCATVMHSVVWQYLPDATQRRIEAALSRHGAAATAQTPLAWLRMEGIGERGCAGLTLTLWPGGETRLLARCDWHGRWIDWL